MIVKSVYLKTHGYLIPVRPRILYSLKEFDQLALAYDIIGTSKAMPTNLTCLDYGTGKGGFLCAYRRDEETSVSPDKFITTKQVGGAL